MRILHTADWHLGLTTNKISRALDHEDFFDWLLPFISEHAVDAVVIAGDIFDTSHPSSGAQDQYYRFLARAAKAAGLQVVVVGGNHDSASRLDAPGSLLQALDIHVVGGLTQDSVDQGRHLIPLKNAQGEVGSVLLAVPYVPEWRLGGRITEAGGEGLVASVAEGFTQLYRLLADQAEAEYPGIPILATGHLTIRGASADEEGREEDIQLHRIGMIDALMPSIFDPRIRYVALGHIHQCYPVDRDRRAWYSGSPVPIGVKDGETARRVLLLDVDGLTEQVSITEHRIPRSRPMLRLRGSLAEVLSEIRNLTPVGPLPPFLYVEVAVETGLEDAERLIRDEIDVHAAECRPVLVEWKAALVGAESGSTRSDAQELRDAAGNLDPREVFAAKVRANGLAHSDELASAFSILLEMNDDDLDSHLAGIREGNA